MKRYFSIIFGSFLLSLAACSGSLDELDRTPDGNGKIIVSAKSLGVTRATEADTDPEATLAWVDVYVMNESKNIVYRERIDKSSSPVVGGGEFVLGKNREDFDAGKGYYFYLIANSSEPLSESAQTWDDLKKLSQKDEHLHLTGHQEQVKDIDVPEYFLMDGFAYVSTSTSDKAPAEMPLMVLNDGANNDDLTLGGTLVRAASKIVVNIKQGDNVDFHKILEGNTPLYSFYQLPISSLLVRPEATTFFNSEKQNTIEWPLNEANFFWKEEAGMKPSLQLVGYAYANDWSKNPANESALLLSIPMMWNKDGDENNTKEAASPVNWYKVPLSKNDKFDRNKYYEINITINAVGAEEQNTPIELKDIEYRTLDWVPVEVTIGNTVPRYLTLNTDLVKIYDTNFDLDQLTFSSSSPIKSIKLKDVFNHNESNGTFSALKVITESDGETEAVYETGDTFSAYYVDKFGQKIQLGTDPNFDIMISNDGYTELTKEQILELENNLLQKYIRAEVPADQQRALNGDIHIYSPINAEKVEDSEGNVIFDLNWDSHFNAVRYLEFEVMNEQGLTATFRVEQTPTTVIRNYEGFFSYRSDFHIGDDPVYHNPEDWKSQDSSNGPIYYDEYGKNTPPTSKEPNHFLNPVVPMLSLAGFQAYYIWEALEDGKLLQKVTSDYGYDEAVYGLMMRNYYRVFDKGKGTFHRGQYYVYNRDGSVKQKYFQGANLTKPSSYFQAVGHTYEDNLDGTPKFYRRHYTGNFFETFQSKVVRQVYEEDPNISVPKIQRKLICRTCTKDKIANPTGRLYIPADECIDPEHHVMNYNYIRTGDKPIKKGMAEIYKVAAGNDGRSWDNFTGLNPSYISSISSKSSTEWQYTTTMVSGAIFHNHRMYYIRINATSTDYTVAVPRMMDEDGKPTEDRERGFTMESADNAKTISPSFMVASQLGESILPENEAHYIMPGIKTLYDLARKQCREYVETRYEDSNGNGQYDVGEPVYHYDDWRLPTKAEIEYIVKHQETSRAMDKVLYAQFYFHASDAFGQYTEKTLLSDEIPEHEDTGWYMRCVRDAFKEPLPVTYSR